MNTEFKFHYNYLNDRSWYKSFENVRGYAFGQSNTNPIKMDKY